MIIQLLGVALISLLTITPTIQQNNIEQLIAPNIEIQPMLFNTPDPNRLWVANQFSYYNVSPSSSSTFDSQRLYTNTNILYNANTTPSEITYSSDTIDRLLFIDDTNFYLTDYSGTVGSVQLSGNHMTDILKEYYLRIHGSYPTSQTFSFTQSDSILQVNSTFYTYSLNGVGGVISGNIYVRDANVYRTFSTFTINSNLTVNAGISLQQLIQNYLQPQITWTISPNDEVKVLYYFLDQSLPLNTPGTYTRTLRARNNYGTVSPGATFTVTINEADTIPPVITSITGNPTDWTNQNVTLTINATDETALGDLNTPPYSFNNGANYQFSNTKTFTTNEIVNVRVRDLSGNFTNQQVIINRIDKQSPAVTLPQGWVSSYPVNTITAQQLLATYNISDNQSGVNTSLTTISNFNPTVIGPYNPLISVTDNVGNTFNYTSPTVNITQPADNTGPVITGPTSLTYQLGTITFNSVIEQYNISDVSGIEPNSISIRNTSNQIITNLNLAIGTYSLRIYARDTLGNETNYPITLIVQDTIAPVITGNTVQQLVVNRTQQDLIDRFSIFDDSDITVEIIGNINYGLPGNYSVTLRATDSVGNITNLSITVNITLPDTTGPLISGAFGISVEVGLFNDNQQFINQYFTITDPSGIKSTVLTGTLDFNLVGSYNVILVATDNEDNVSTRQLTIKVYDPINLADYNPLTDLFSGIFGGLLSMIFTIGTINLLGFRLLDAMALIILGSVIWLVYKAIKGGS
jgi:hypothetical protein